MSSHPKSSYTVTTLKTVFALVISTLLGFGLAQSQVRVVAASDLQFALSEIAQDFEQQNPSFQVQLSFGSSGKIFTQLTQGLPADLYFSADEVFPKRLEQAGLTVPNTVKMYAVGRMVLWVSNSLVQQGLDPRTLGLRVLLDRRVTQVALANPVHAPYGRAAVSLLEHFNLLKNTRKAEWETMTAGIPAFYNISALQQGKPQFDFIYGENISQAAQLALTSTGVGLIALSIARSQALQAAGQFWLAPLSSHLRLNQTYVILRGQDRPEVRSFYNYLASPAAHRVLKKYGFLLPGERLE